MGRSTAKALWRHLFADVCHGNDPNLVLAKYRFSPMESLSLIILVSLMEAWGWAQRWIDLVCDYNPQNWPLRIVGFGGYYDMLPAQKVSALLGSIAPSSDRFAVGLC